MTEKRTLSLSARQWRVLLHDNLDILKAAVQQTETLDEDGLRKFSAQLDDMKMLAAAWYQVSVPATAEVPAQLNQGSDQVSQANGAVAPKRGWPKGKKRNRAAQAQVVQ